MAALWADAAEKVADSARPVPSGIERPRPTGITEERRIELAVRQAERRELVRPAPPHFKPELVDRKLRLTLIPRETTIRAGERLWYRIELQNVGREPVRFREHSTFLKNGDRYASGRWNFDLIEPGGGRVALNIGSIFGARLVSDAKLDVVPVPGAENMSDAEVAAFIRRDYAHRRADMDLDVVLAPGETLVSRPWRWHDAIERLERKRRGETDLTPRPEGPWREFWTNYRFETPGRYEMTLEYDDTGPTAPAEDVLRELERQGFSRESVIADYAARAKKQLGRFMSEPVTFEVLR